MPMRWITWMNFARRTRRSLTLTNETAGGGSGQRVDLGQYVSALRHDQKNKAFNPSFRQLLHVGFKIAAKKGERYLDALKKHEAVIAENVTGNLFERHMKPLLCPAN